MDSFIEVLGIETSCDDTGAAVLSGNKILGEAVHSQLDKHLMFGGIIVRILFSNCVN